MKIIIVKPLESGETNIKATCSKEERRALEDLEGSDINVPTLMVKVEGVPEDIKKQVHRELFEKMYVAILKDLQDNSDAENNKPLFEGSEG